MKVKVDVCEKGSAMSFDNYKLVIPFDSDLSLERKLSESEMNELLDDIITVLGYKKIMETFNCSVQDARDIDEKINRYRECRDCDLKMKECYRCIKVCESPLEQSLLKALTRNNIKTELQLRINKDGSVVHYPEPVDPDKILTLPDFSVST